MKNHIKLIFLLATLFSTSALAQFKFGVTGGLNISKFTVSNDDYKEYINKIRPGFFVGPTAIYNVPKTGLSFESGVFLDFRGATSKNNNNSKSIYCKSLQIPVNIRFGINYAETVYWYIFTGPQFGLPLGRDHHIISGKSKSTGHALERQWTDEKTTFSWNFGIGGVVMDHIQVKLSYNLALRQTGEIQQIDLIDGTSKTLTEGKAHACQVAISYLF